MRCSCISKKRYIGRTKDLRQRWETETRLAYQYESGIRNKNNQALLYRTTARIGTENWIQIPIKVSTPGSVVSDEINLIKIHQSCLNWQNQRSSRFAPKKVNKEIRRRPGKRQRITKGRISTRTGNYTIKYISDAVLFQFR